MKNLLSIAALAGMVLASAARAESVGPCMEGAVSQFGRYVGEWKITDERLAQDGSEWLPGQGARWTFECVGDGTAVQDFWRPTGGGFGTNLRSYNADTGRWEIVWAAASQQGLMHISAEQHADGRIVMDVLSPEQDPPRRIIFFPPDDAGWDWVMEWSFDEGQSWMPVYRIRATPWR